jgi:hypothetical protein
VDARRPGQRSEFTAQAGDVDVEGVVVNDGAVRPRGLNEGVAADGVSRRRRQPGEQAELGGRELGRCTSALCRVDRRVQAQFAYRHGLVVTGAPKEGLDARHKLGEVERLGEVVVAA